MKIFKKLSIAALLASSVVTFADVPTLQKNLAKEYPATKVASVKESPIKDIYEVVLGKNLAYTDVSGKFYLLTMRLNTLKATVLVNLQFFQTHNAHIAKDWKWKLRN